MNDKNFVAYGDAETVLTEFADDIKNKVDKVSGKGLSTNDYTTDEKNKLAGIEVGADKTAVDTALSSTSENPLQNKVINSALLNKVDKVSGKGLSTNDYTTTEKNKLAGIASGAEVNVQSDWSVTTSSSDAYIKNKPTSLPASDVYSWAKASTKPSYTKSEIGLGNVDNTADADKSVNYAATAGTANALSRNMAGDSVARCVWFSDAADPGKLVYDEDFKYNPSNNLLTVGGLAEKAVLKNPIYDNPNFNNIPADIGTGSLQFREITGTSATNAPADYTNSDNPWAHLFTMVHHGGSGFYTQLLLGMTYNGMHYRNGQSGWRKVFDTGNCTVELDVVGTSNNNGTFYNNAIKFPNGLCIQWGRHTNMPNGTAVYFKYAYSYRPSVTFANGQGYAANDYAMIWFNDGALSSNVDWMAVGYIS